LMVDLRNFGESDGTPEGITFGDLEVNDVVGALDFLAARVPELPAAVTWITDFQQAGPFGTHIQAYRLGPAAYVARVTTFLDGVFTATAAR